MNQARTYLFNVRLILIFSGLLLLFYLESRVIVEKNYYIMVALMGIPLIIYVLKNIEKTVYLLFLGILFLDWLSDKWHLLPRQITWLPELISIIIVLYIIFILAKFHKIPFKTPYLFVYIFAFLTFLGIAINHVEPPVAIAGVRNSLKFLPFFLLPFYYDFSDDFMWKFMKFIFFFSFFQCPIAIFQRLYYGGSSGDPIGGTLGFSTSGILSLFCGFVIIFWTAFYFKSNLRLKKYFLGLIMIFIPMCINETKISIFLIPLIFFSIIIFIPEARKKVKYLLWGLIFAGAILIFYIFIHNYFYKGKTGGGIQQYLTDPSPTIEYVYSNKYTKAGTLNRIPLLIFAYDNIKENFEHLLFGVGAGNASDSFFRGALGEYYAKYRLFRIDNLFLSNMLWEYGMIGTLIYFMICVFIFIKVFSLRTLEHIKGIIAAGFLGMTLVLLVSTVYINTMRVNLFIYLYWFLAGYLMNIYYYKQVKSD